MIDDSLTNLYEYLFDKFCPQVSKNVYYMNPPTSLTSDDSKNGFIVIKAFEIKDESEFSLGAYATTRVNICAFVPSQKRGRLNKTLYKRFENAVKDVIRNSFNDDKSPYSIVEDSMLEYDDFYNQNDITFNLFIKSFKVIIN